MKPDSDHGDRIAHAVVQAFAKAMNEVTRQHGPLPPRVLADALRQLAADFDAMDKGGRRSI